MIPLDATQGRRAPQGPCRSEAAALALSVYGLSITDGGAFLWHIKWSAFNRHCQPAAS